MLNFFGKSNPQLQIKLRIAFPLHPHEHIFNDLNLQGAG